MGRCTFCRSRFFTVIETRFIPMTKTESGLTLFLKKRCKRCKMKLYFKKQLPGGCMTLITGKDWCAAMDKTQPVRDAGRFNIFASEYSKRMSRGVQAGGGHRYA